MARNASKMYDEIWEKESWEPLQLNPNAFSTTRYDDTARMLENERKDGELLEIGCGSGRFIISFSDYFRLGVGTDISGNRIGLAQKILREHYPERAQKIKFEVVDGDRPLPFEDGSFDIVVLCAVAEHIVDLFGLMDETARVCKKGGCVVMTVPNICYLRHIMELLMGHVPVTGSVYTTTIEEWRHYGWDNGHLHYFSKKALGELLRHVGFEPERWSGSGRWAKLRRYYINFMGDITVKAKRK